MDPKFLVVEIDSKEQAIQLVQIMLDKGFARLMLLDDLSKHPNLAKPPNDSRETACSPIVPNEKSFPVEEEKVFPSLSQVSNPMVTSTVVKQEPSSLIGNEDEEEEEEEMVLTSRHSVPSKKRPYEHANEYREQLMNMLCGEPEIVPIGVNSTSDEPSGSNEDSPTLKKSKNGEYHECRLCGVRVKSPRSGRWNLQMHVIALHCVGRQYKCKECNYLDYRKSTMRKHTISQHGSDIPPHNITDDIMRTEWHEAMKKCFPEFAHRTGFLS
ncbi:hypothetical protein GCK72_005392 [Caenorhabditis remanei]|uniref:CRE-LIR-3 protein n=1 Tax=Caenorhabditis remanei TaxID=31234 RepID=E3LFD6_CAERE|nr:hypothetical protein GCK72_005392 [Caenorhabditis remanei]EFO86005.1 CRE-LIR-3 protein [Caenorhabditis remanei]KAF1765440.1 hypothetical protein GCK72_005392 [Caenorhabditis remanei]